MPVVTVPLEETNKTILNSVYFTIIKDLIKMVDIPHTTLIAMHKGLEINKTDNRTNVNTESLPNLPSTFSDRRIIADIVENYNEDSITTTAVSYDDAYPIFRDPSIDVNVYPVYVRSDVTITLNYHSPSKTEAYRIRDDIRIKLSQMRNIGHHEAEYDIVLPLVVEDFICDVHDLKKRLFPSNLDDYFRSHSTKRVHMITDMANADNARIAVRERQVRIVGMFDFSGLPDEVESDNETNTYRVSFPYKFAVDIPRAMCLSYPTMICNAPMPFKYLEHIQKGKIHALKEQHSSIAASYSLRAMRHFESHQQLSLRTNELLPLNLPLFDEFPVRVGHKGYVVLASFLVQVDENDKRTLMNLRELDEFCIDEKLLEFIRTVERPWIINPYMSYFYLGVHQKDRYFDNNMLKIDENLNVISLVDVPLVKPTRITLSLCLDTTTLDPTVFERFRSHKDIYLLYLREMVKAINNYRPEFAQMNIAENTFYRSFLRMIQDSIAVEDNSFLQSFIDVIALDNKMLEILVGVISNNYPRMYRYLLQHTDIGKYHRNPNYKKNYTGVENYAMRSVMYASVKAYDLDNPRPTPE